MTRPATATQSWATDTNYTDPGETWDGTATKVDPAAFRATGWVPGVKLPAQYANYDAALMWEWLNFFEEYDDCLDFDGTDTFAGDATFSGTIDFSGTLNIPGGAFLNVTGDLDVQSGGEIDVESGGFIRIESGGTLNFAAGGLLTGTIGGSPTFAGTSVALSASTALFGTAGAALTGAFDVQADLSTSSGGQIRRSREVQFATDTNQTGLDPATADFYWIANGVMSTTRTWTLNNGSPGSVLHLVNADTTNGVTIAGTLAFGGVTLGGAANPRSRRFVWRDFGGAGGWVEDGSGA